MAGYLGAIHDWMLCPCQEEQCSERGRNVVSALPDLLPPARTPAGLQPRLKRSNSPVDDDWVRSKSASQEWVPDPGRP